MCYPWRGEMRWEVTDIASLGSHRAGPSGLSFSAISQSSYLISDLEIIPISPANAALRESPCLQIWHWLSLLTTQCTVLYIHFSGVGNFRTLHSTHSRLYSTNHWHCIALLNNERFWLGSKNKIFETINLPTKMIECISKCQDYNQRLIFMIYDCAVNMN